MKGGRRTSKGADEADVHHGDGDNGDDDDDDDDGDDDDDDDDDDNDGGCDSDDFNDDDGDRNDDNNDGCCSLGLYFMLYESFRRKPGYGLPPAPVCPGSSKSFVASPDASL